MRLDENNGNNLWRYVISKYINAVMIAFELLNEGENPPPTYQEIRCHMIFDIKIEDFRKKSRYVSAGRATVAPLTLTYVSVVSRESFHIALTIAALNDLEVKTYEIHNSYLTASCS